MQQPNQTTDIYTMTISALVYSARQVHHDGKRDMVSRRTVDSLKAKEIIYVGELVANSKKTLRRARNYGEKCHSLLEKLLAPHGLMFPEQDLENMEHGLVRQDKTSSGAQFVYVKGTAETRVAALRALYETPEKASAFLQAGKPFPYIVPAAIEQTDLEKITSLCAQFNIKACPVNDHTPGGINRFESGDFDHRKVLQGLSDHFIVNAKRLGKNQPVVLDDLPEVIFYGPQP